MKFEYLMQCNAGFIECSQSPQIGATIQSSVTLVQFVCFQILYSKYLVKS